MQGRYLYETAIWGTILGLVLGTIFFQIPVLSIIWWLTAMMFWGFISYFFGYVTNLFLTLLVYALVIGLFVRWGMRRVENF